MCPPTMCPGERVSRRIHVPFVQPSEHTLAVRDHLCALPIGLPVIPSNRHLIDQWTMNEDDLVLRWYKRNCGDARRGLRARYELRCLTNHRFPPGSDFHHFHRTGILEARSYRLAGVITQEAAIEGKIVVVIEDVILRGVRQLALVERRRRCMHWRGREPEGNAHDEWTRPEGLQNLLIRAGEGQLSQGAHTKPLAGAALPKSLPKGAEHFQRYAVTGDGMFNRAKRIKCCRSDTQRGLRCLL